MGLETSSLRLELSRYNDDLRCRLLSLLKNRPYVSHYPDNSFLARESELGELLFALYALMQKKPVQLPHIELTPEGSLSLFKRSGLAWGGLPYPRFHAEAAGLCYLLGVFIQDETWINKAKRMAVWQLQTLDSQGLPLPALFQQEGKCPYEELLLANYFLFSLVAEENLFSKLASLHYEMLVRKGTSPFAEFVWHFCEGRVDTSTPLHLPSSIYDPALGWVGVRKGNCTAVAVAKGCKSTMGVFAARDVRVVGYGPQKLPLGDCSDFGLAGGEPLAMEKKEEEFFLLSEGPIAVHHNRLTGIDSIEDVGYSGLWCRAEQAYKEGKLDITCRFTSLPPFQGWAFVFFVKAEALIVASFQKLKPRTLDRYRGPKQKISLDGKEEKIILTPLEGCNEMEIIPLGGEKSYWSADFLIAFFLEDEKKAYQWQLSCEK